MSKVKEIKVRKIRNIRIWPSVVSTIILFLLFAALIYGFCVMYISTVFESKITDGITDCVAILKSLSTEFTSATDPSEKLSQYVNIIDDVKGICIVDEKGDVIESAGESIEALADYRKVSLIADFGENLEVYLPPEYAGSLENSNVEVSWGAGNAMIPFLEEEGVKSFFKSLSFGSNGVVTEFHGYLTGEMPDKTTCIINYNFEYHVYDFLYAIVVGFFIFMLCMIVLLYNISTIIKLLKSKRQMYNLMYTDSVTGGRNTLYFYRRAQSLIRRRNKGDSKYAIVSIRMEKYRGYCTCFGLKEAEDLLEDFYSVLQRHIDRSKEVAVHADLSDFALLLAYRDETELEGRITAILKRLGDVRQNQTFYFNTGICAVTKASHDASVMYIDAQAARASIKDENAGGIAWFSKELRDNQIWERRVEDEMERAIENHEFQMYLQPKYSTDTEEISAAEALVRWIHPEDGLIAPYKFIPIFENNGFIIRLDDYMINEVARQQAKWLSMGHKLVPISVNVSRAHFMKEDLAEHIRDIVDRYEVPHEMIELELTESAFFDDKSTLINTVRKMREYGFKVSMDDFGAGYSSLNSLKEIPLDVIKLDAEFFRGSDSGERGKLIVSQTIDLSKKLGMEIVAEGIETREQVDFLASHDCDLIQGYYYAKPMPVSEYEARAYKSDLE